MDDQSATNKGAMSLVIELALAVLMCTYYVLESLILWSLPTSWRAKDVSKDIVLITGGGSGLGRMMAVEFARLGSAIVVWDIDAIGNAETVRQVEEVGGRAHAFTCDISSKESIYETAKKVRDRVGVVTILINNAGIVIGKSLLDTPDTAIEKIFAINVLAHFWTTKAFLSGMLDEGRGHIVTIASLAGHIGNAKLIDYCSTKFAAVGFDESLHAELVAIGRQDIQTTCVCPFFISTGMFDGVCSKVITQLTPDYAVKEIMRAVLVNQEVLIMPRIFYPMLVLKAVVCRKALDAIGKGLGGFNMMDRFRGRVAKDGASGAATAAASPSGNATAVHEE